MLVFTYNLFMIVGPRPFLVITVSDYLEKFTLNTLNSEHRMISSVSLIGHKIFSPVPFVVRKEEILDKRSPIMCVTR